MSGIARILAREYLGGPNETLILRDEKSFSRMKQLLQGKPHNVLQSRDAAFMIASMTKGGRSASAREQDTGTLKRRILVSTSIIPDCESALARIVHICMEAAQLGYEILAWHSEIRANYDTKDREMAAWDSILSFRWLPPEPIDTDEVAALIRSASLVLATRMASRDHRRVAGVAACGIATNEKMRTVFEELTMPYSKSREMTTLTFMDILHSDFQPSFTQAKTFSREAEQGGTRVLEIIYQGKSFASSSASERRE